MNYTLNQLEVFLKVSQMGSVTKAAEVLNLTQPAVSIQLKNLQAQFDVPLTEIVGRKLFLTDFGKDIALAAENILNQVYAINYKTASYKGQLTGRLKISVVSTGKYVMPHFLGDFLRLNPHVELVMDVTNKRNVIMSLEHNEVDFALVSVLPRNSDFEQLDLLPNKLYLVGNSDKVAAYAADPALIFEHETMIFREEGSATRQIMEDYLYRNNIPLGRKMELTSNEALKQALIAGIGISIMPLIGIKHELNVSDLAILPLKNLPITTTWSLIWNEGKRHSPAALAYLDYIRSNKDALISERFHWYNGYTAAGTNAG